MPGLTRRQARPVRLPARGEGARRLPGLPRAARRVEPEDAQARERLPALPGMPLADHRRHPRRAAAVVPQHQPAALPELHHLSRGHPRLQPLAAVVQVGEKPMNTRTLARWLSLPLLVVATAAFAQLPIDIEVGYRLTNIGGNEDMYRTQINERNGFLIRAFTMQGVSEMSLVD